ncbi:MAG: hypothetical protein HFI09_00865, partial [Bacilli bacterium]|nr:hypothetical protein [Bacilli bacterium]
MPENDLKNVISTLFTEYQTKVLNQNYGEFTKTTYFFLEKLKTYKGIYQSVDERIEKIINIVEQYKEQMSLKIDTEVQNEM